MKTLRVLIKDYKVSKDKKLITMLLNDLDDEKDDFGVALLSEELGPMFGIGVIESEDLMRKMLHGIKGKKVNLEMHPMVKEIDVSNWKDGVSMDKVMKHHSDLDYFPYYELLTDMQESNED